MQPVTKILVVLDAYEEIPADESRLPIEALKATRLAGDPAQCGIFLLICGYEKFLHDSYYGFGDELKVLREEHCRQLEEKLAIVSRRLSTQGFQVESGLVWGHPRYEQIVRKSIDISADLVIHHTRAYAKLSRAILSNESWQLVRYSPKPLLLVKDREWGRSPTLLAAVDPVHSRDKPVKLDDKIVATALDFSTQLEGSVHLLHAYAEAGRPFALPERILQAHREAFEQLYLKFEMAPEQCHLVKESPVVALQAYEQKLKSDIIVMGALSRSRLADSLIGNTAEQVLDYLESDVLIVKPQSIS